MAPTTYLAPGVYVEEVPSAQQPIAGVGTNTVGFIGVVPNVIHYPERFDGYDPVSAQAALTLRLLKPGDESEASKKARQDATDKLQGGLKRVAAELKALDDKTIPDAQRAVDNAANPAERVEAETKLAAARASRDQAAARQKELQDRLAGQPAPPATAPPPAGQPTAAQPVIPEYLLRPSDLRPYYLKALPVVVEPFDTRLCTNFSEYVSLFGQFSADDAAQPSGTALYPGHRALTHAVYGFFKNGGTRCFVARIPSNNKKDIDRALGAMESIDAVAVVAAPGLDGDAWTSLIEHCETCEDRFAILDPPAEISESDGNLDVMKLSYGPDSILPGRNKNAAFYFPYIEVIDPAKQLQDEDLARETSAPGGRVTIGVPPRYRGRICVPPSGHIAGIYARTDEQRGVHKAPANAAVIGAVNVRYYISKSKQALLNPQGVNCIRNMNGNINVWGARTLGGDMNGEWKYINVRRLFLFLRESIDEGTQWVVFEPNDYTLWGKIRRNVTAFLTNVWRTGALFGLTPEEAFYVKCDAETNPAELRDLGMVVTEIGVAIVRPAEFVIFRITQSTGPRTT